MIATIVCGLVIIVCIVILLLNFTNVIYYKYENAVVMKLLLALSLFILIISLIYGYVHDGSKEEHESERKTIVYLLETNLNEYTISLAERYNEAELFGNNYWCRFTLREENLIDIKSYLYNNKEVENDEKLYFNCFVKYN